jgi:hypothetical protein
MHGVNEDGNSIFEERIVLFRAGDFDEAADLARQEASEYIKINEGFVLDDHIGVYVLGHDESDLNGREVFSLLMQAKMDSKSFYKKRYEKFQYYTEE